MTERPAIDHTILSPSGKVSRRAREQALRREHDRLFPPGFWTPTEPDEAKKRADRAATLRRSAQNLRDLAARGMSPRKFAREADSLEQEALDIEGTDTP